MTALLAALHRWNAATWRVLHADPGDDMKALILEQGLARLEYLNVAFTRGSTAP